MPKKIRVLLVSAECTEFLSKQSDKFNEKFDYLLQIIEEQKQIKALLLKNW